MSGETEETNVYEENIINNSNTLNDNDNINDLNDNDESNDNNSNNNNNNNNETMLELQLGDIIEITNPLNEKLNDKIFIIDYIDNQKLFLIDAETLEKIKIKITEDGILGDGNITKIAILSRTETPSYARQHDLLPGKWINIFFGGDYPAIITGEITNLEQDMIEVTTVDNDVIYINFDFKGIPEDLPIEGIEIREKPYKSQEIQKIGEEQEPEEGLALEEEGELPEIQREQRKLGDRTIQVNIPTTNIKDQIREFIIKADQIKFGEEELGPVVQYVDVSSKSQRYSLETQVADLLDELLSTIPNSQRTNRVLNNIHITIERFKQLRQHFSAFDEYGNVSEMIVNFSNIKPLSEYFKKFNQNLFWLLPVVKNVKKIYNVQNVDEEDNDVINLDMNMSLVGLAEIGERYKSNFMANEENKYSTYLKEIQPEFTPFEPVSDDNLYGIMTERPVGDDLNVLIDNLGDMYSSIIHNGAIKSRRFVIQRYNLASTKLDTIDSTGSKMITKRVKIASNDMLSLLSVVTLPEPAIRFSRINLPNTNMLDKANLNNTFLNYWELLKQKTYINDKYIYSLDEELTFDENNFANSIKNYVLSLDPDAENKYNAKETYVKFFNAIIPKIRVLFNLMKKYIKGKLSIVDVISYLEPFLIYSDNLTYMQYVEITEFINQQISLYNKEYIEKMRIFNSLTRIRSKQINYDFVYSIVSSLSQKDDLRENVLDSYGLNGIESNKSGPNDNTNSELLRKILLRDYSRLYTTALSYQMLPLMFPDDVSDILNREKDEKSNLIKNDKTNEQCKKYVIAKYYTSLENLEEDNNRTIYFDKRYDSTNYGLLEDDKNGYGKEMMNMSPEDLKSFITGDLVNKKKMSDFEAEYMANTLLDGHKQVIDGQYAILYKGYNKNVNEEIDYYVRKDNVWTIDNELKDVINTDNSSILCNLQDKCISVTNKDEDKCESIKFDELTLQNKLIKNVLDEFDTRYNISSQELKREITEKMEYLIDVIGMLTKIENSNLLKYNNQRYKLGIEDENINANKITSPSAKLLNLILSQSDFGKKQHDIIRFSSTFTRKYIQNSIGPLGEWESEHWLYCIKTNTPLLPRFKLELADSYVTNADLYRENLDFIISKQGKLSDDGNLWTDKYSGWTICPVDFDIEEGYEDGFKASSRATLEGDAGDKITSILQQQTQENPDKQLYSTPQTKTINNVVNSLCVAMGINVESQKEFIMNGVLYGINQTLESETDYNKKVREMAEKGKKILSYKDLYNSTLLYYTFGMFLIAVQTSIPSIKTRKTHPGCVRSFTGYPFEGSGDLSSLTYLGCVAYDIRESGEPWYVLKGKKKDSIIEKIKSVIDGVLLANPEVKQKFEAKTEYLLLNPVNDIPDEHDIANWTQFLPPLKPFKMRHLVNISSEFKKSLLNDLRTGSKHQREKLNVINSKIIQFSLGLQEKIQDVVKKNSLLLNSASGEPYLENACCQTSKGETTIDYFISQDQDIKNFNGVVNDLTNIVEDIISYSKSVLLCSSVDTKNKYPTIANDFSEKTIYLAFIHYCKFKSLMPIPANLLPLCTSKPDADIIDKSDSIDRTIQRLKDDGRNYNYEQFIRLIQIISQKNIINTGIEDKNITSITKLLHILDEISNEINIDEKKQITEIVDPELIHLIANSLDTFDIATQETTKEVKSLNNYLIKNIESIKEDIIDFMKKNSGSNVTKSSIRKAEKVITNLAVWATDESTRNENNRISDERMYNAVNFYKTFIENFISVFPNIILNSVNYENTFIPGYYKFSANHSSKLRDYIVKYYEKLKTFYGLHTLTNVLNSVPSLCKNILLLSKNTPCFTTIKIGDIEIKPVFDERTSKFFYEYYLLKVIMTFIDLTDREDMIVTEVKKKSEITDLFSVEYLDDNETKADLGFTSRNETDIRLLTGNKKELKQSVSKLLIAFIEIMNNQKDVINTSYEEIQDRVFKIREREKDMVTDRLRAMTDEERDADTILKINKLGMYGKSLQKGLTAYDKDFYDEEREMRDELEKAEKNVKKKNKNITDNNLDIYVDDYMDEMNVANDIDYEVNDISYMNDDYYDGNVDGMGAPEEEPDDYGNYE